MSQSEATSMNDETLDEIIERIVEVARPEKEGSVILLTVIARYGEDF